MITVSIVSHLQAALAADLLRDLAALRRNDLRVVLTLNVPEDMPADAGLPVEVIRNPLRKGFGANHNAALRRSRDEHVCILNPDVRFTQDPFPALLEATRPARVGLAGPRVLAPSGSVENNARRFPTLTSLALKALGRAPRMDYPDSDREFSADWVGGMFMFARRESFDAMGGFDERYFLYYEDIDLCRRMRQRGYEIRLAPAACIVHAARRSSHRNLRFLLWHLRSILRYLTTRYE